MTEINFLNNNSNNTNNKLNIKLIIWISIFILFMYDIKLMKLIHIKILFGLNFTDYRIGLNLILAGMGILSCLVSFSVNKNKELFIIALMYIVFFIDIYNANITGYLIEENYRYSAILTSFLRLCIMCIAASKSTKLKKIIINNKKKNIIFLMLISIIAIKIEYLYIMPYGTFINILYKYYNIILTIAYMLLSISFFKKSLKINDYKYSLIAFSCIMLSIKSVYDYYYSISLIKEISLIGYSTILMGFIVFILGLSIELIQTNIRNQILNEQRDLFIKIIDDHKNSNVIICDENYYIQYKNKKAIDNINKDGLFYSSNMNTGDKFDLMKIFGDISNIDLIEEELANKGCYVKDVYKKVSNEILDLTIHIHEVDKKKYKVITIRDASEKYKLEKALLEYEAIKKEDKMKDEFFANISHELKTPLNVIYSTTQLLDLSINKTNFKDIYLKYNKCLNINCKRILRLVNNIVDMAKKEIEFETPNFKNYNIVNIVEEMTMSVVSYAKEKNLNLIFDTDEEELYIRCDVDMLERVILNLLSNAIKFSDSGGDILVSIFSNKDWVSIKVKNNGIGIDKNIQSKIFDRFVQGDKSIRRKKEGSGIGLSLVKTFTELMDGRVELQSDGINGAEFIVLLPNKIIEANSKIEGEEYHIDLQKIELELSDIYELYND